MNKSDYEKIKEDAKKRIELIQKELSDARFAFIMHNKPCNVDDIVTIERNGLKPVTGEVKAFGILEDGNVYVTALNVGASKRIYISKPYKSIKIINEI